jgi:hypothetical protein
MIANFSFCSLSCVFIIDGCNDEIKQTFSKTFMTVLDDYLKQKKDSSDSPNTCSMFDFVNAIKIMEMTWSIEEDNRYEKNEPFIDIAIARHPEDDGQYFFVRQCVILVNNITSEKKSICCGVLSYKLNNVGTNTDENQFSLTGAQFHVPPKLAEKFKAGTILFFSISISFDRKIFNIRFVLLF